MSKAVDQNQMYFDLADALAQIIFARCIADHDSDPYYDHYNENYLGIVPDMLARLGVMRGVRPDAALVSGSHVFEDGWRPHKPLTIKRHPGAPSIFDLIVAACLMVDWDRGQFRTMPQSWDVTNAPPAPAPDLTDHKRFRPEPQLALSFFAWRKAVACLEELGLVVWNEGGGWELIHGVSGSTPIDLARTYQTTRHLTAERLGGVRFLFPLR